MRVIDESFLKPRHLEEQTEPNMCCLRSLKLIMEIERLYQGGVVLHKDGTLRVETLTVPRTSVIDTPCLEGCRLPPPAQTHKHVQEAQHNWKHEKNESDFGTPAVCV